MQKCKYCKKDLQKIDCLKYSKDTQDGVSIHKVIVILLTMISYIYKPAKSTLANFRYKTTCTNKDCIGYLDGCCCVNKHSNSYEFKI